MTSITIKRSPRDKEHPYAIVPRAFCEDMKISMELKGLLLYCFSRKDDWEYHVHHLYKLHKIGYRKCLRLLEEGINAGYISRKCKKEGNLNCGVTYLFCEDKSFSKKVTDMTKTHIPEKLFKKESKIGRKTKNSKNVTDVSDFRHAESKTLVNTESTQVNTESTHHSPPVSSFYKDNVTKTMSGGSGEKKKTVPFKKSTRTVEGPKRYRLSEEQSGIYSWLTENCPDVQIGTRCFWAKSYSWDRIKEVFHEAKSRNPKSLGAYMNKLFLENAQVPNAHSQECMEYAKSFKESVDWYELNIGKKYATFQIGNSFIDINLHQNPTDFARQLHEKYKNFKSRN